MLHVADSGMSCPNESCKDTEDSDVMMCNKIKQTFVLIYFIFFYYILFCFILFYFILLYFILFYFILFHFILHYFTYFCRSGLMCNKIKL